MEVQQINKPLVARLKAQMLKNGLNPKTLAERANVGRSFVYDILNGKSTNPTSSKLAAISEELGVSVQYLMSGVQSTSDDGKESWGDIVEIPSLEVEPTASGSVIVTVEAKKRPYYFRNEWIRNDLQAKPQNIRAYFIQGDSMSPTLVDDDMILVDISYKSPNPAGLYLVFDGNGMAPKRLESISQDKISVRSDNAQYSSYEATLDDIEIVGKIVWVAREL